MALSYWLIEPIDQGIIVFVLQTDHFTIGNIFFRSINNRQKGNLVVLVQANNMMNSLFVFTWVTVISKAVASKAALWFIVDCRSAPFGITDSVYSHSAT